MATSNAAQYLSDVRAKFGDAIEHFDDATLIKAMGKVRSTKGAIQNTKLAIEGKNNHLNRPVVTVEVTPESDEAPAPKAKKGKAKKNADAPSLEDILATGAR